MFRYKASGKVSQVKVLLKVKCSGSKVPDQAKGLGQRLWIRLKIFVRLQVKTEEVDSYNLEESTDSSLTCPVSIGDRMM